MRSPMAVDALFAPYRVAGALLLKRVDGAERVAITAVDKYGDLVTWTAPVGQVPAIGTVIEVAMRRQEDPDLPDEPPTERES